MRKFTWQMLRSLCIREGWFTEGTNEQYIRLRRAFEEFEDEESLAWIIWVCSDIENVGSVREQVDKIKIVLEDEIDE